MAMGPWGGAGNVKVFRVKHMMKLNGQDAQVGWHARTTIGAPATTAAIAAAAGTWFTDHFKNILNVGDQLVGTDVTDIVDATGTFVDHGNIAGVLGANSVTALPSFITVSVSLKSEIRRRYGQGRMLWPVRAEALIDSEAIAAGSLATFNGVMAAFEEAFITGVVNPNIIACNLHGILPQREAPGQEGYRPQIPATWYDVTTLRLNTRVSSLRSRRVA